MIYYSKEYSKLFKKQDCPEDLGSEELFTVPEAQFTSTVSQEDANRKAEEWAETEGQLYANRVGGCCMVYYSDEVSGEFRRCDCPEGEAQDEPVIHSLPSGAYVSKFSKDDANFWATEQLKREGFEKAKKEGVCKTLYYSKPVRGWYKRKCAEGWDAEEKFYRFPAGHTTSFISEEDATEKAKAELDAFATYDVRYCTECFPANKNNGESDFGYHFD